ncbi:LysM peptidoglycan-binding domain-containing protein [Agrobacterium vitis]|uniref:LysM peptidoglycan-binding domain-containing protein n=1 Tax=Allorhizobium ampelinum TaxID=3025782 RepID=UPI001F24EE82|nr:LysM peptidoglycan-binding domain-containing protein [Allorhizobium ampelinum]MCF1459919.1 LysM peptidoglycan-binding domain-containing protein [Allorhizobium ampelinum]
MLGTFFYTIQKGDTFTSIARQITACAGVTAAEIEAATSMPEPSALQVLSIPSGTKGIPALRYTVQPGDTFVSIAATVNASASVTVKQIAAANSHISGTDLQIGGLIAIPATGAHSVPTPHPAPPENIGFWHKTWHRPAGPSNTTMGLAFSGHSDPTKALAQSAPILPSLAGEKYITLGGGNASGRFSTSTLQSIDTCIKSGAFSAYKGIAYDIEEGNSGLSAAFQQSFANARAAGFKVLVTVSHSAPFGIADAKSLMFDFFDDTNIDILSPQLYTTGEEPSNDWATSHGVTWSDYATAKAQIAPSIVHANLYPNVQSTFKIHDVTPNGYILWNGSKTKLKR